MTGDVRFLLEELMCTVSHRRLLVVLGVQNFLSAHCTDSWRDMMQKQREREEVTLDEIATYFVLLIILHKQLLVSLCSLSTQ